jgi:hypothetical protein
MANEPEVIRQQMEETRTSLTEKIGLLEQQVVGTVQDATSAVAETVENVMEAVTETVDTVKDTLDVRLQVQRHPWAMFGGSVALGFLGGCLFPMAGTDRGRTTRPIREMPWEKDWASAPGPSVRTPRGSEAAERWEREPAKTYRDSSRGGWLSWLSEQFGPEIAKLEGLAVGAAAGVVRDLVAQSLPEDLQPKVAAILDDVTTKLGGEPVRGPLLKASEYRNGARREEIPTERAASMGVV